MTASSGEGFVNRVAVKDDRAYTATGKKGVQVVDLAKAREVFQPCCGTAGHAQMLQALGTDGRGYGQSAVVATIPVSRPGGKESMLYDLEAGSFVLDGQSQTLVVATGFATPLVIVNPQTVGVVWQGTLKASDNSAELTTGIAVGLGRVNDRDVAVVAGGGLMGGVSKGLLATVSLADPENPAVLGFLDLTQEPCLAQTGVNLDVLVKDTTAYVGGTDPGVPGKGCVVLVSLDGPRPVLAGVLTNIGGRLALGENGILFGTANSRFGGADPLGGVRTATLGPLPWIAPVPLALAKETLQPTSTVFETVDDTRLELRMTPANYPVAAATLEVAFGGRPVIGPTRVTLTNGFGSYTIPAGLRLSVPDTPGKRASAAVATATLSVVAQGSELRSAPRSIPVGSIGLTVDSNNDTVVNDDDDEAVRTDPNKNTSQALAFAFWEQDPDLDKLTGEDAVDRVERLVDYATLRLRVPGSLAPDQRVAIETSSGSWKIRQKIGKGKLYLKDRSTAEAQAASLSKADNPTLGESLEPFSIGLGRTEIPRELLLKPGDKEFLVQCNAGIPGAGVSCSPGALRVFTRREGTDWKAVSARDVDIRSLKSWMSVFTARNAFTPRLPAPELSLLPGWTDIPERPKRITVLLHGFNVNGEDAITKTFPRLFKRLYWTGHPALERQGNETDGFAHTVAVAWPGDETGAVSLPALYYPEDEFNALQAGVPLALFLSRNLRGRQVNIVAHSLGNMVVNSALMLAPSQTVNKYVMYDAAIAAEAFSENYQRSAIEARSLGPHAASLGYPDDSKWIAEWEKMQRSTGSCQIPGLCTKADDWLALLNQVNPNLDPKPDFTIRWRQYAQSSAWEGVFAGNPARTQMLNVFNTNDQVLRIGEGILDISPFAVHAWFACQTLQKPANGLPGFWATLQDADLEEEELLWSAVAGDPLLSPSLAGRARLTRRWAEMAYWFPALSAPAGSQAVAELGGAGNASFSAEGQSSSYRATHSYLVVKALNEVWRPFEVIRDFFR